MVADNETMPGSYLLPPLLFRLATSKDRTTLQPLRFASAFSITVTLIALVLNVTALSTLIVLGFVPNPKTALWVGSTLTVFITFPISFVLSHIIAKQVKCLSISHERYKHLSHTDGLTGLRNRAGLHAEAKHLDEDYCLAFFDIDHFKSINDNYGHAAGDAVISGIARRIAEAFPASSLLSRLGGEEFVVATSNIPLADFSAYCEACRQSVEAQPFVAESVSINVTISIGISTPRNDEAFENVMHRADVALYRAKQSGRNHVVVDDEQSLAG
ncbi:hypothetical protein RRU01S_04_00570 [Agrobacterium rubi TR3 = NBRC 13261]|uniref:diguanylate cyclase n=2 Tax=Agrobacterium rubi TaxID=28099 RepID=A0A081CRD9_9HYPH|nr:hypothetical protein RRU01S_04_00570 [Agrobacterium rubi TR3 = NBRC 13261]